MKYIDADALGICKVKREAFNVPERADGWNSAIDIINNIPGVSIPKISKIPRLAQGTVVPPNREFLAVLGDNKKEHET